MKKRITTLIAALVIFMSVFTTAKAETVPGLKPVLKTPILEGQSYWLDITNKNEYIIIGSSSYNLGELKNLNKGSRDIAIFKYDKNCKLQWIKTFGGSQDDDLIEIRECENGDIIVFGATYSNDKDLQNLGLSGDYSKFAFRMDTDGNIKWKKAFSNSGNKNLILGDKSFYYEYYKDGNIVREKYDFDGNKIFEIKDQSSEDDYYYNSIISESKDEGFFVDNNNLIKYNDKGEKQWIAQKWTLGSDMEYPIDFGIRGIKETSDNGFIAIIGYKEVCPDIIGFVKYNNKGIIEWEAKNSFYGDINIEEENDRYIITYEKQVTEYSKDGKKLREFELENIQNDVNILNVKYIENMGYLALGFVSSDGAEEGLRNNKVVVIQYDKNGNKKWVKYYGGNSILRLTNSLYIPNTNETFILGYSMYANSSYYNNVLFKLDSSYVNVSSIKLNITSKTLKKGQSVKLSAVISPNNASNKALIWASSNVKAAKVDSTGKVTAVGKGTAVITVKSVDGEYTAQCKITVK